MSLIKKLRPFKPYAIATLAGGCITFGFAPYYYGIVGLISPLILIWCLFKQPPKTAAKLGLCYGLGYFGMSSYWVYFSIHDFGNASILLASFITGLFIFYLAVFFAGFAYSLNKWFSKNDKVYIVLAFPVLWVIFEILRGWLLTGFPWAYIGYTQTASPLNAIAPIAGVFGVSFIAVFISCLVYAIMEYFAHNKQQTWYLRKLILFLILIVASCFALKPIKWTKTASSEINLAMIQGNIPQQVRWAPEFVQKIMDKYYTLTLDAVDADLIIWPEAAIPLPIPYANNYLTAVEKLIKDKQTALILGIPEKLTTSNQYYNNLVGLGNAQGNYHKVNLVPFGEYVPLEAMLRGLIGFFDLPMSSFVSGQSNQQQLKFYQYNLAPAICYEIAYPFYVQKLAKNSDAILTVSNDAWFGNSIGPHQHLQIAQFRALETGQYVLRATNTGFTAIINPQGVIADIIEQYETTILKGQFTAMAGLTPWVRFGPWPLFALLVCGLGFAVFLVKRTK